jgi:hypothetical protein
MSLAKTGMHKSLTLISILLYAALTAVAQSPTGDVPPSGSMAVSPARFELEMKPGTEQTVVVNLDYRAGTGSTAPVRIMASLNDWTITKDGRVEYSRANSLPNSASPWLIYTPGEAAVVPGTIHQIRVTIAVPLNATPGDHLTSLIIEQRPESYKNEGNLKQVVVRYRMASVFYIKVPGLTKKGNFENLLAESTPGGFTVTPVLKNEGNSVIRPTSSLTVIDADGKTVTEMTGLEPLPVLGGSETAQPLVVEKQLPPGTYSVKYRVDFQDGRPATEGVTDLIVKTAPQIATGNPPAKKP